MSGDWLEEYRRAQERPVVAPSSTESDEEPEPAVTVLPPTVKQLGDPRKDATWTLLPLPPGVCSQCGKDHLPDEPHNQQSLHYQYAFYAEHDRWPTWADAMAHCTPEMQKNWRAALREHGIEVEGSDGLG